MLARHGVDDAEDLLMRVAAGARRTGSIPSYAAAAAAVARIEFARGNSDAARTRATEAVDLLSAKGDWVWATDAAPVAVRALLECDIIGSQQTDADGIASMELPPGQRGNNRSYETIFEGDDFYLSSSDERAGRGKGKGRADTER